MLTACPLAGPGCEVARQLKLRAVGWLETHAVEFGSPDAEWALLALQGDVSKLDAPKRRAALRFMLGLPFNPTDSDDLGLAKAYARGFLRPLIRVLLCGKAAAVRASNGYGRRDLFSYIRWRMEDATRCGTGGGGKRKWIPRGMWLQRRCAREAWEGGVWSRSCFRSWRAYVAACGPRAHKSWLSRNPFGDIRAILHLGGGSVRSTFCEKQGGVLVSLRAWEMLSAFNTWARCEDSPNFPRCRRPARHESAGVGRACMLIRSISLPEVAEGEEIRRALDRIISNLVSLVARGAKSTAAIFGKLVSDADKATRISRAKKLRRWRSDNKPKALGPLRSAFLEGTQADGRGNWTVDCLLAARGTHASGFQLLVRWTGPHADAWCPIGSLSKVLKKPAQRLIRATLGLHPRPQRTSYAPPHSSRTRFYRLVRGGDAKGKVWAPPSFVGFHRFPCALGPDSSRHAKVVSDPLEELDLRGDSWSLTFSDVRTITNPPALPMSTPGKTPATLKRRADQAPWREAKKTAKGGGGDLVTVQHLRELEALGRCSARSHNDAFGESPFPASRKSPRLATVVVAHTAASQPRSNDMLSRGIVRPRVEDPRLPRGPPAKRKSTLTAREWSTTLGAPVAAQP